MKCTYCGEEMIRMCTLIFWMMTEGKCREKNLDRRIIFGDNISFDYPENFSL